MNTLSAAPVVLQGGVAGEAAPMAPGEVAARPAVTLAGILAKLSPAERDWLRPRITLAPWEVKAARLDARDDAVRELAAHDGCVRPTVLANRIAAKLSAYAKAGWIEDKIDLADDAPRERVLLCRIMRASPKPLGWRQVRNIISGDRTPLQ